MKCINELILSYLSLVLGQTFVVMRGPVVAAHGVGVGGARSPRLGARAPALTTETPVSYTHLTLPTNREV